MAFVATVAYRGKRTIFRLVILKRRNCLINFGLHVVIILKRILDTSFEILNINFCLNFLAFKQRNLITLGIRKKLFPAITLTITRTTTHTHTHIYIYTYRERERERERERDHPGARGSVVG
jgi:hypothetical protein